ncbi:hypothetical protein [Undibacterium sp. Ji50W]|uniref:hypothetical protein n=1 Tax=Undibacterium sp. Ji50W TaxID=3413041 RepID=UPI003BF5D3C1
MAYRHRLYYPKNKTVNRIQGPQASNDSLTRKNSYLLKTMAKPGRHASIVMLLQKHNDGADGMYWRSGFGCGLGSVDGVASHGATECEDGIAVVRAGFELRFAKRNSRPCHHRNPGMSADGKQVFAIGSRGF